MSETTLKDCTKYASKIPKLLADELSEAEAKEVYSHLSTCKRCHNQYMTLQEGFVAVAKGKLKTRNAK